MKKLMTDKEKEQKLAEVYKLKAEAEFNDDDLAWAKEKFQDPEDFHRLRRVFRIISDEERGLFYQEDISTITDGDDLKKFAIDVKVQNLVHERIRNSLLNFYSLVREDLKREKKESLDKQQEQIKKELDKEKELKERTEQIENPLGKNL